MKTDNNTVVGIVEQIENKLEPIFTKKLPSMSDNSKEILVKIMPWLSLIMMLMVIPVLFAALGLSFIVLPVSLLSGFRAGLGSGISLIFAIVLMVMELMAIPGLFKRQMKSWKLLFYVALLTGLQNIISFNLGGLIIGGGISCYLLFQVKNKFNN